MAVTPPRLEDAVYDRTRTWTRDEQAALLSYLENQRHRMALAAKYEHPALLAQGLDPKYVITPAIELVSKALRDVVAKRDGRLVITCPPQELKSTLCSIYLPLWLLQSDPDTRIMQASYAETLAQNHSAASRDLVRVNGTGGVEPITGAPTPDKLGFSLSEDKQAASWWRVGGRKGGVFAVGVGGPATGRPSDFTIIDDPVKNREDADSPTQRQKVWDWFQQVALTRLAPGASMCVIQTRWHVDDLAGRLIRAGWDHINIPALSEEGIPDALNRPPGVYLESARGRTPQDFQRIRKEVGERGWFALYQGVPVPTVGGMFMRSWFTDNRINADTVDLPRRIVAVDPAETGRGDEAGIVALGVSGDGTIVATDDKSGKYTSEQWAQAAVELAVETGASDLVFEAYSSQTTYERVIKLAWESYARSRGLVAASRPFRIVAWRGKGNAVARSAGLRQAVETGKFRLWGHRVATLEEMAVTWVEGSHCPDRVAAAVVGFEHLMGRGVSSVSPAGGWGRVNSGLPGNPVDKVADRAAAGWGPSNYTAANPFGRGGFGS